MVLLGNGDGTFGVGSPLTADVSFNFSSGTGSVAVGDMNKDGKADVVVSQPGFVALFYGKGDGTFTAGPRHAALPAYMQVTITDVDGDGNPDVMLGTSSGGITTDGGAGIQPPLFQILMGRGDGTFVDSPVYAQGRYGNSSNGAAGQQIAQADFNGDGKADVLVFNPSNDGSKPSALALLPGNGTGALGAAIGSSVNLVPNVLVAADMNKDGKPDVVLGGNFTGLPGRLSVLINQGNGSFGAEQDYALPNFPISIAVGDFNGDGLMDVAVGVAPFYPGGAGPTGVYVLFGQANGTLAAPVKIDGSKFPTGLAAADLNGDGKADLVVADQGTFSYVGGPQQVNGALHVYLGKADGSFTTAVSPTTPATNYSAVALGDLNGDGKLDLIVGGNVAGNTVGSAGTANLYTFLGNGDGSFQAAKTTPTASNYGVGTTSIALADFDHDGRLDVAAGDATAFTAVLLGNGDGTFANTLLALGQRPGALAAADLNGDGFPELIVGVGVNLNVFLNANAWAPAVVAPTATTTAMAASATSLAAGQTLTLTATVAAASGSAIPAGTATFSDGATTLGAVALDATGKAVFSTSSLAAGAHSLSASYGGNASFASSASAALSVQVTASAAADFALALSPVAGTASAGQAAQTTLTVTPRNGFSQSVSMSCSGLPAGATCSFSPATLAISGSAAASSTLTIGTSARTAMNSVREPQDPMNPLVPGGLLMAGLGLPIMLGRRRRRATDRFVQRSVLGLLLLGGVTLLNGCGGGGGADGGGAGGGGGSGGTPAGTYTITITASGGAATHTATYALTVN